MENNAEINEAIIAKKVFDPEIKFEFVSRLGDTSPIEGQPLKYKLPKRGTKKSAGYDFFCIENEIIQPGQIKIIKTGVKSKFPDELCLLLLNRSSNAKKKGLVLMNGIGLVDADYYNNPDNEGEIGFMFMNIKDEPILIEKGEKLGQGLFTNYFLVTNESDEVTEERTSGWGSTGK